MNTPFVLRAALLLAAAATAGASPISAPSRISAVTVYADRAVVTREASLNVAAAGDVEIAFERLPADLMDQSLQATGRGSADLQLVDVTARPTFLEFAGNERVKALEEQLHALARDERALTDRAAVLGQQREYVEKIEHATTSPGKDATLAATPIDTWSRLLAFSADQRQRIATEIQATETQREELQARRAALEQQLNELRGQGDRSYKTVVVRLTAAAPGALELTLRYAVPDAGWTPAYEARVDARGHAVRLGYFGQVRQNTGEDWAQVDLTLSTARPSLGGAAPELSPWVVQPREIVPLDAAADAGGAEMNVRGQRKTLAAPAAAMRASLREFTPTLAAVDTQATSATFRIPGRVAVPADNAPHKLGIATLPLQAEFSYASSPKLLPAAFLNASVSNSSDYPLLAGALNVFLDDTFVASSSLRTVMPGEKFDLALGADEAVSVRRQLKQRFTEDTGLVSKSRRITYDFTITVQNHRATAEKLVVQDQVPVSRHEKIVVKVLAPDARDAKPDAAGVLKWTLTLQPGEKRELPLKFSVEHPADLPVAGLE